MSQFQVPHSTSTVRVRIIDTTSHIIVPFDMGAPPIKGHETLDCPSYAFLIEHASGRNLLYDLGVRKDPENLAPVVVEHIRRNGWHVSAESNVRDLLEQHGVDPKSIEAIIWSHWHYDHTGDPSTFDSFTALIVGPGCKNTFLPGYPSNEGSPILESDYAGRELRELDFTTDELHIGQFDAVDYFGDGSFYLLDAPGHTVGHICALARVATSPPSFIFMGGDCCHHSGELRPSRYLPLPDSIDPNPLAGVNGHTDAGTDIVCPGAIFEHLHRDGDRTKPFYGQARPGIPLCDPEVAEETIIKVQEADVDPHVLVVIAHDMYLRGVVDFFPESANDFVRKGWVGKCRWRFLKDFGGAIVQGRSKF
ncbi:Metallo-hydrolase/oxidoreductase [Aspergillus insuetus]